MLGWLYFLDVCNNFNLTILESLKLSKVNDFGQRSDRDLKLLTKSFILVNAPQYHVVKAFLTVLTFLITT